MRRFGANGWRCSSLDRAQRNRGYDFWNTPMKDDVPSPPYRPFAWEKSYPAGMRWDSPIATSTLQELLDRAVADYGDQPALEYQDRRISYRGLGEEAAR